MSKKKPTIKQLTNAELKRLTKTLETLEAPMFRIYKKFSGGFAEAKMFDYDEKIIDVEFQFGVDGERIYIEQYKVDRLTMEIIN